MEESPQIWSDSLPPPSPHDIPGALHTPSPAPSENTPHILTERYFQEESCRVDVGA